MIEKYRVQSGTLDITIEAQNHRMAVIKALDETDACSLGELISVLRDGESLDGEVIMKTEFVLECMGLKVEKPIL